MTSQAPTLNDLALKHGTDKASGRHDFAHIYESFLSPWRDGPMNLLEIGVKLGASVRMWEEYYPQGQIYGVDIKEAAREHATDRIHVFIGDQKDTHLLSEVVAASGPLDVVVDDGSHRYPDQKATLEFLWPHVKPGGVYIMEDTHTSYSEKYDMGYRKPQSTIEMLKDIVDDIQVRSHKQPEVLGLVGSVHFYPQTCVITKRRLRQRD